MHSLFKTLGCQQRIAILQYLMEQDEYTCICKVEEMIDRDRSVTYRHFRNLESAGLIETRKNGRRVEAKVKDPDKLRDMMKLAEKISVK